MLSRERCSRRLSTGPIEDVASRRHPTRNELVDIPHHGEHLWGKSLPVALASSLADDARSRDLVANADLMDEISRSRPKHPKEAFKGSVG